ncbi:MAG: YheV family putative metal-binding protein [Trueperaceae bacterium]
MFDAEGSHEGDACPECGDEGTIRWRFEEGFDEIECPACGFRSEADEIAALRDEAGDLLLRDDDAPPPPPGRPLRA